MRLPTMQSDGTILIEADGVSITAMPGSLMFLKAQKGDFGDLLSESEGLEIRRESMVVSPFQAKTALEAAGLLTQVEAIIALADPTTQRAWDEAVEFKRASPTINGLSAQLGLTDEQVDDLFRTAAGIEA